MKTVRLDTTTIVDRDSFHGACKNLFGFPDWYGANMDAWIECMSELDDVDGMTGFKLGSGEMLQIEVTGVEPFAERTPEIFEDLILCIAFVNQDYVKRTGIPGISLILL